MVEGGKEGPPSAVSVPIVGGTFVMVYERQKYYFHYRERATKKKHKRTAVVTEVTNEAGVIGISIGTGRNARVLLYDFSHNGGVEFLKISKR